MYYSHINELYPWVPFSFGERQILDHYKEFVAVSLFLFFCALLWPECSKETIVCVDSVAVSIHRVEDTMYYKPSKLYVKGAFLGFRR